MRLLTAILGALILLSGEVLAQTCPLSAAPTGSFQTLVAPDRGPVLFRSGLNVNADGAPNAYHRVLGPTIVDPGLLHICNGVSVLEERGGRMVNRYPQIGGSNVAASKAASIACKRDVFNLQEAGFPPCTSGSCLRIFGFFSPPRS